MTAVTWDERLITRERAANLAGTWELHVDNQEYDINYLRCAQCQGNILQLPRAGRLVTLDGILSATVRHMVMSHNYSLSGAPSVPA